jgi:hypothetical protein
MMVRADMVSLILEMLGVKAAGQSAPSEDSSTASTGLGSIYDRLEADGLAPFELSAIPDWAITPIATMCAYELCPHFGITGERLADIASRYNGSQEELQRQVAAKQAPVQRKYRFF